MKVESNSTLAARQPASDASATDDLATRIEALTVMSSDVLRSEWRRLHRSQPPNLSRDLLMRALAYRVQELALGGLSKATRRRLERFAEQLKANGHVAMDTGVALHAGQRLVREWRGKAHAVTVCDEGYLYDGQTHTSLSAIARLITGAHWSGPRFFGLDRSRMRSSQDSAANVEQDTDGSGNA